MCHYPWDSYKGNTNKKTTSLLEEEKNYMVLDIAETKDEGTMYFMPKIVVVPIQDTNKEVPDFFEIITPTDEIIKIPVGSKIRVISRKI